MCRRFDPGPRHSAKFLANPRVSKTFGESPHGAGLTPHRRATKQATSVPTSTSSLAGVRISSALVPLAISGELRGTVLSAHRAALNLTCSGHLVTCGLSELGALPNGVTVVDMKDLRGVAAPGDEVIVNVRSARPWSPLILPLADRPSTEAVARSAQIAAARAPAGGFGPLLCSLDEDPQDGDLFRSAARPILSALLAATRGGDRLAAVTAAGSLVGLGAGMTPSGDDALVGFTAALTVARAALARPIARAAAEAGARTTLVARTYLEYAARGEYAERVHDLIAAVAAGDSTRIVRGMSWGATSGADLVLGILLGARAAWLSAEARAA